MLHTHIVFIWVISKLESNRNIHPSKDNIWITFTKQNRSNEIHKTFTALKYNLTTTYHIIKQFYSHTNMQLWKSRNVFVFNIVSIDLHCIVDWIVLLVSIASRIVSCNTYSANKTKQNAKHLKYIINYTTHYKT